MNRFFGRWPAAGMCLFDTADGCFMNFAYDWAFARPIRKVCRRAPGWAICTGTLPGEVVLPGRSPGPIRWIESAMASNCDNAGASAMSTRGVPGRR